MLLLQIAWPDGNVARFPAGGNIESDLHKLIAHRIRDNAISDILDEINKKYIWQRTENNIREVITTKLEPILEKSIELAIMDLKLETNKGFAQK